MKTICIDFDGVIYPNMRYAGTAILNEKPIEKAKESLKKLSEQYKIIIHSSRFNDDNGYKAVLEWLEKYEFNYEVSRYKPTAHIYLDDRGVRFDGDWNKAIEDIENFTQWQEEDKRKIKRLRAAAKRKIPMIK